MPSKPTATAKARAPPPSTHHHALLEDDNDDQPTGGGKLGLYVALAGLSSAGIAAAATYAKRAQEMNTIFEEYDRGRKTLGATQMMEHFDLFQMFYSKMALVAGKTSLPTIKWVSPPAASPARGRGGEIGPTAPVPVDLEEAGGGSGGLGGPAAAGGRQD